MADMDTATAPEAAQDEPIELIPDNGKEIGMWCSMRLGSLGLPQADDTFWEEFSDECREWEWADMDWAYIREQLSSVAEDLADAPSADPIIELPGRTARERAFIEQWFGYGCTPVAARLKGSRPMMFSGLHHLRAMANYPLTEHDAEVLGLKSGSFCEGNALASGVQVPVLVC